MIRTLTIYPVSNLQIYHQQYKQSHKVAHHIPSTCYFYTWKHIPFEQLHPISSPLPPVSSNNCSDLLF